MAQLPLRNNNTPLGQQIMALVQPEIESAIKKQSLSRLRSLEEELRKAVSEIVHFGIYPVQKAAVEVAEATGQEKTMREREWDGMSKDVEFGRALPVDTLCILTEDMTDVVNNWLEQHDAPEPIRALVKALPTIYAGSVILDAESELPDLHAAVLTDAFREATVQLYSMRKGGESKGYK